MTSSINLRPGEQIVIQTHRKRAWYDILGSIFMTLLVLFVFAAGVGMMRLASLNNPYGRLGSGFECYAQLILLLIVFSGIADVISRLISEVTLTDRRIAVKGAPNPWTHYEIPLDEIQHLSSTLGGIRIKQKNRWLTKAVATANKWDFINAYNDLISQGDNRVPPAPLQTWGGLNVSDKQPAILPPATPPIPVQAETQREVDSGKTKKCPMCAEQIPLEATVCGYCGANFEVTIKDGQVVSHFLEMPIAPMQLPAEKAPSQARAIKQIAPSESQYIKPWVVIIIPTLVLAVVVGLMYAGKNLMDVSGTTRNPTRTANAPATQQANNTRATMTAQTSWENTFGAPILNQIENHQPNFRDDFSTTAGRFARWSSMTENGITFADGVMRMAGENWIGAGGSLIAQDFAISFDAKPLVIGSGSNFAVTFRGANDQWYDFGCNLYDTWCRMMAFIEGEEPEQVRGSASDTDPGQGRNILVIAQGNEFAFYIDEKPFAYVRDNRLHGDWVDIGLWSSPGSSEIEFDNVKFWDLNNLIP